MPAISYHISIRLGRLNILRVRSLPLNIPTVRASHFITPVLLDESVLAIVAMSDESRRHGLFHNMSYSKLAVLLGLFTAQRDMCLFLAKSAANLPTFGVHASEFFIDFDRQTFSFEVAERTFG